VIHRPGRYIGQGDTSARVFHRPGPFISQGVYGQGDTSARVFHRPGPFISQGVYGQGDTSARVFTARVIHRSGCLRPGSHLLGRVVCSSTRAELFLVCSYRQGRSYFFMFTKVRAELFFVSITTRTMLFSRFQRRICRSRL
jgi:hypothetical protein